MNHGEKRMTCPGCARPWVLSIGAKGQDMFTLNDVCTRWQLTEHEVVELVTTGKVYCQAHPFRADSFAFFVAEEEGKGSKPPEFDASFRLGCDIDEKVEAWRKHGHPPLVFSQADIDDAEVRNPLLALVARSCSNPTAPEAPAIPPAGTPKSRADYLRTQGMSEGEIMFDLKANFPRLKQYAAAALALGEDIPAQNDPDWKKRFGDKWLYHVAKAKNSQP
jgi:hypothetical protein